METCTTKMMDPIPVKELTLKLILLGDAGVGKSSLLRRFTNEERPSGVYMPTVGVDFRVKQLQVQDQYVRVMLWDTAGQERFRSMTKQYYKGSHCVILVYDVSSMDSFLHVQNWIKDFQRFVGDHVHKVLVANKCDVSNEDRIVSEIDGQLLGREIDIELFETSAKTGQNVSEMFSETINRLVVGLQRKATYFPQSVSPLSTPIHLKCQDRHKKKRCCRF